MDFVNSGFGPETQENVYPVRIVGIGISPDDGHVTLRLAFMRNKKGQVEMVEATVDFPEEDATALAREIPRMLAHHKREQN